MIRKLFTPTIILLLVFYHEVQAQVPTCDVSVPYALVDLRGNPNGTWESDVLTRSGNCCGTLHPNNCVSFEILLDTGSAMINFEIASGAIPSGSMFYQIGCGPQVAVGQPICIVGPGPHYLTFCKPGTNSNTYKVTSIPKPIFPKNDTARIGCNLPIHVLGLVENSISWTSVFPGAVGAYNSYLSCTNNCDSIIYTPAVGAPAYVDYKICGTPIATLCGYVAVCDTVRIYNFAALIASVSPNPATFCAGGPGVLLAGSASGGQTPYSYTWFDQTPSVVGSNATYNPTLGGTYQLRVKDILYDSLYCPAAFVSVPVIAVSPPTVNAGLDQTLCPTSPTATLNGIIANATGGIWSGGAGTYNPNNTSLTIEYTPTATEILAGQVTLTLTSTGAGGGCGSANDAVTIYFPPALSITLPAQFLTCNNSTTILSPIVSGGITPYAYTWSNGFSSTSITVGEGNYCLYITDAMGCQVSACTNVIVPPLLTVTMSSVDVTTNGGSDGSATATPSGGNSPYTYLWSPGGQTTQTATGLSYGAYCVDVTDANGCTVHSCVVVNEPRCLSFQVTTSETNILCNGDSTGTALANVSGGTAPYTYVWNTIPIQTSASATNLGAGTYLVFVTESNGCIDVGSIVITQPTQLTNTMNSTNVTVIGGSDGSATANPNGGVSAYTYSWSNGGTTQTIANLLAGIYVVTITDNNGCSIMDSVQISDPTCSGLLMTTYTTSVSCPGGSDGSATAQLFFGIPPYTYIWSNGETTATISGLSAGNYSVTGSAAFNCTQFANVIITQPSPLSLTLVPTNIRCSSSHDGTIELTVSGGTYPYTYVWSNGLAVEDQINLGPGSYTVTVTDANGCTATASTTLLEPNPIIVTSLNTDVTCNGGSNGTIDATINGGIFPYTYSWSNGATTQDLTGLSIGTYVLTITDANNCVNSNLSVPINEPSIVTIDSIQKVCPIPGSGVAQVTVYPSGGSNSTYQVSFDNGLTFLGAGIYTTTLAVGITYQVVVKDNNGCMTTSATTLIIPPAVDIQAVSFNPCIADGVTSIPVTLTTTGGNGGPLQASFDNGVTFLAPGVMTTNLATGSSYNIIAKDSTGCLSVTETISIPNEIILSGIVSSYNGYQVSCFGSTNGSINLSASGGTGIYTYAWSNSSTTQDVSGLPAGTYSVVVTDSINCRDTINFTLTQPQALSSTLVSSNNFNGYPVSCFGSTNGAVNLTVNGGVPTYIYSWNTGATTEDIFSLAAGTYSVLITDANGCSTTQSIILTQPVALTSSTVVTNALCNGNTNGSIDLSVNGGVTDYSFSWSNSATTEDISGVGAGSYSVTITDANACITTASATITEPTLLTSSGVVTNLSCFQSGNGAIDVSVNGGMGSYSYSWNNNATTQDLTEITAGTYVVTITDANGCTNTQSFIVTEPLLLTLSTVVSSDFNGYDVSCYGSTNGAIDLTVGGGTPGYIFSWSNGATTEDISSIGAGSYTVTVTDANGCISTSSIVLTQPTALTSSSAVTNVLCNGNTSGAIDLTVNGGVPSYSFSWSNSATTEDISGIGAGSYSVTITDANACTTTASATITEPTLLTSSGVVTNLTCYQSGNGAIDVSVNGGMGSYSYSWNNNATTQDLINITAGTYVVVITDANGCTNTQSFIVTEPSLLTSSVVASTDFNGYEVSCNGSTNGAIDLTVSGGTAGYIFSWSNGATTEDISSIGAGSYTVTVTDANGCVSTSSVVLTQPAALTSSTLVVNVLCNGDMTGVINLTINGGVIAYSYNWSNGSLVEDISNIGAGSYSVIITDANGCTASASVAITEPTLLTSSGVVTNLSCFQSGNGAIDLSVNGGVGSYSYSWNNAATSQSISGLAAGSYSVTITDANGCINTQSFTVTEPPILAISATVTTNFNGYEVNCNGSTNGAIDLTVGGGTPGYIFSWSNGATTEDISSIGAGTYSVTVMDANGCLQIAAVTLTEPSQLDIYASHQDVPCNGFQTGSIDISMNGGVQPYSYQWSNAQTTEDLNNIGAGNYTVNVTDDNGCIIDTTIIITETMPVLLTNTFSNPLCHGDNNGTIDLTLTGGTPPYSYIWSNGQTTEDLTSIFAGIYTVIATDLNNCTAHDTVLIIEPEILASIVSSPLYPDGYNISLPGGNDGSIDLTVTGGMVPYQYQWSNGNTTEDLNGLFAGTYSVIITDANGCTSATSITLDQPLVLEMPTGYSPNGDGANDYFEVHGIEAYPNNKIEVFNRWGNLVYSADKYHNNWNGYNDSGDRLPDGTYFVILEINNGDIKLHGYVDLRR